MEIWKAASTEILKYWAYSYDQELLVSELGLVKDWMKD